MSKDKIIIGLLLFSLFVSVVAMSYLYVTKDNDKAITEYETAVNQIVEIDYEQRQMELDQIVEDGMMNVQYLPYCVFNGTVSETFNVKNIKNNKHPIAFTLIDEKGDIFYKSNQIDLGYELNNIELDKELSKGIHNCNIQIGYVTEGNVASVFPITVEIK